jgi:hypothetical protein
MKAQVASIPSEQQIEGLSDQDLIQLRHRVEKEVRRRGLKLTVGDIGERLVVAYFNGTPGLPKLQIAPAGTKNIDALSRAGDRYTIKTVLDARKTGTIYPDRDNPDKQLFEFLLIVILSEDRVLKSIHQFSWDQFLAVRCWDKRMSAWYVPYSTKALTYSTKIV